MSGLVSFVESLVSTTTGTVDDGRLDQLRTKIGERLSVENDARVRERVRELLLHRGVKSADFRVCAVSLRLAGPHWGSDVRQTAHDLLRHSEPLVRHAALCCLVDAGNAIVSMSESEWLDLLLDDSMYVQRQAQILFAHQLVNDAECEAMFERLLQGCMDVNHARCVAGIVAAMVVLSPAAPLAVERRIRPTERLVEAVIVSDSPLVTEFRSVLEVLNAAWKRCSELSDVAENERLFEEWLQWLMGRFRLEDAAQMCASIESCRDIVARYAVVLQEKNCPVALLLSVHKKLGPSKDAIALCEAALCNERLLARASSLLCEWRVPIETSMAIALWDSQGNVSSAWLKNVLSLQCEWCTDERLIKRLESVLATGDSWLCMAVWDCVARNAAIASPLLVSACIAALERLQWDSMAVAHCWEGLLAKLGPSHVVIARVLPWTNVSHLDKAMSVFAQWNMADAPPAVLAQIVAAVSTCLAQQDDWCTARGAVQWLATNRHLHPRGEAMLREAAHHWARPVRQLARVALSITECDSDTDDGDRHLLQTPGSQPLECCE